MSAEDFRWDGEVRSWDRVGFVPYGSALQTCDAGAENGFGIDYVASGDGEVAEDIIVDGIEEGGE